MEKMERLVSVVIPTYNHANFLEGALNSVIAQSYQNWEAIVVNNFSTDNTIEVINKLNDPRIRRIDFKNNGIIAASRNVGINKSKGDYIAFLDSDDVWYQNKIENCVAKLDNGFDVVCHGNNPTDLTSLKADQNMGFSR